MAGSYNHAVEENGALRDPLDMHTMLENFGDCYEAIEEMYGMIWWLAKTAADYGGSLPEEWVEMAERKYHEGIEISPTNRPAMF